jgi:hypothetical protein
MLSIIGIKKTIKQHTADMDITDSVDYKISTSSVIQGVPEKKDDSLIYQRIFNIYTPN